MTNEEYQATQDLLLAYSRELGQLDLRGFIEMARMADTMGPILDPTLWRLGNRRLEAIRRLAEAGRCLQIAYENLKTMVAVDAEEAVEGRAFNP